MKLAPYLFNLLIAVLLFFTNCTTNLEKDSESIKKALFSKDNFFPNCTTTFIDSSRLVKSIDRMDSIQFFDDGYYVDEHKKIIKTKNKLNDKHKGFDYIIEKSKQIDTLFTYKLENDSLFIWEEIDKSWEFKIKLHQNKKLNADDVLKSRETYFYSDFFDTTDIRVFRIVDVYHSSISHHPKNEKIKISEFYINRNDIIIAIKYKCNYFYNEKLSHSKHE